MISMPAYRHVFSLLLVVVVGAIGACDSFIDETEPPIDSIGDEQITTESQVPFIVRGIQARFATTYGRLALLSGGLSDELVFDHRAGTATFPTFEEIEKGEVSYSNFDVTEVFNGLGELRLFSDNLLSVSSHASGRMIASLLLAKLSS